MGRRVGMVARIAQQSELTCRIAVLGTRPFVISR